MIASCPLQWPTGWPRTPAGGHKFGRFGTKERRPGASWTSTRNITMAEACGRVLDELARMGIERQDVVISTNVRTRVDGLPRSNEREPNDSGAAVYWQDRKGNRRVMAIDQYVKLADNVAAIAATLDAMRAIERHGGAQILDRAFAGFTALPAPAKKRNWRDVMTFGESTPTAEQLKQRYRELVSIRHPDKGGTDESMAELNRAYDEAKQEVGL